VTDFQDIYLQKDAHISKKEKSQPAPKSEPVVNNTKAEGKHEKNKDRETTPKVMVLLHEIDVTEGHPVSRGASLPADISTPGCLHYPSSILLLIWFPGNCNLLGLF